MDRVLFFRGLNLGDRRLTNAELSGALETCGCANVRVYQASGNAVVRDDRSEAALQAAVETGLATALGYAVDTYVREPSELRGLLAARPFADRVHTGKAQIAFLRGAPDPAVLEDFRTPDDWLALHDRQLFWWPRGSVLDGTLDLRGLEAALGRWTMRTRGTVERLTRKFLRPV